MSNPVHFDIHNFDVDVLDAAALIKAAQTQKPIDGWNLHPISPTCYQAVPSDTATYPVVGLHRKANPQRQFNILEALYNLGMWVAPRPFYANDGWLVCEWLHGEPLQHPPSVDDENQWHRIMALLATPSRLPFAQYASTIALHGNGPQSPADVIQRIEAALSQLAPDDNRLEDLMALVERVRQQVAPALNYLPPITFNHLDPLPPHFIWDGQYLRLVGWDKADWADTAYAVGQLCAHPAYEDVPTSHWVWYRWELARLTHDDSLSARATTYTNLLQVYWAIKATHPKQRERYYQRAQRAFA